ncbi:ribonuclease R, partial [Mycobacterium tuberculosis]|nr:ribonuclease R [Mycobacterium tuberculosis]
MRQSLEEILMAFFMEHESESFFVQEISEHFGFTGSKDFKILVKLLADLEDSGKIVLTRQGKFGFNQKNRTLEGTFRLNDKGFGFVTVEEGKPDIFIPRTDVHGAMDGDTVAIRIVQEENPYNDKAASGTIVKIIERAVKQVVGIYTR